MGNPITDEIERRAKKYVEDKYGSGAYEKQQELTKVVKWRGGGGGGGSSSSGISSFAPPTAQQEAEQKILLAKLQSEAQERQAQAEKTKIENLRRDLERRGLQERSEILRNREGQRIKVNIIKNNNQDTRVIIRRNLDTGEITYQSFERPKGERYTTQTGGVSEIPNQQIDTRQSIMPTTSTGKLTTKILNIQSNLDSRIKKDKQLIRNFASNKNLTRLKVLTKKNNLTNQEKQEVSRIRRDISKNSNVISDFIISTIGKSLIDLGVGSVTLLNQLRKDPYKTVTSLPSAISVP
jgi:hypothetical protein